MKKKVVSNTVMWSPSDERIKSSRMYEFMEKINKKYYLNLASFANLQKWSIENKIQFWSSIWDFFEIIGFKGNVPYIDPENQMPGSKFFPNGKVNYAENMLSGDVSGTAIVFKSEDKIRKEISWKELKTQVATLANYFKKEGVVKGDRVVAYMPNMPETVIMMLATSSVGAIFSSASPDFGVDGVLDRFGQIKPKILLTTDGYWYNGKEVNITNKVLDVVKSLLPPRIRRDLQEALATSICPDLVGHKMLIDSFQTRGEEISIIVRELARESRGYRHVCRRVVRPLQIPI